MIMMIMMIMMMIIMVMMKIDYDQSIIYWSIIDIDR